MGMGVRVERTKTAVERICATSGTADELLEELAAELHRAVPHDGSSWFGVDPVTMLATAPSRVEGLDASYCETFWHLEFHEQDTGLFADLARGDGVSALRLATDDRPARSVRYRDFMKPQGYADELRGVFRTGDTTWGVVGLYRVGTEAFDDDDIAVVRAISPVVAGALRVHVRQANPWLGQPSAPGLVVVDRGGQVLSANDEALCWLRDMWPTTLDDQDRLLGLRDPYELCDQGLAVPTAIYALVAKARAVTDGRERGPARLRLRDRRGRWVVLHASALSGPGSRGGETVAVVIEAAKSAEVAPIIIDAYSLTSRERDVLGAIARGGSTSEIAAELFLSPHTVRDYVKTVFEKFGVSSRSELVARLYGEHYAEPLHETMVDIA